MTEVFEFERRLGTSVLHLRWDRRTDELAGNERLTCELDDEAQKEWRLPAEGACCFYSLESPSLRQGSVATRVSGTLRVVSWTASEAVVTFDLEATMARTDTFGQPPPERIRGTHRLTRRLR